MTGTAAGNVIANFILGAASWDPIAGISFCDVYGWAYDLSGAPVAGAAVSFRLALAPVTNDAVALWISSESTTTAADGYWEGHLPYSTDIIVADGPRTGKQSGCRITIPAIGLSRAYYIPSAPACAWDDLDELNWTR
jgi:hypothetical protein